MAIAVPSSWQTGDDRQLHQLRMEADVRRLLRRANDPFRLAAFPLAQTLCEVTGIASPGAALRCVIEKAFEEDWHEARLRDLLLPADMGNGGARSLTAHRLQISTRHFQRRRAKAVSILARHIRNLVGAPPPAATGDREGAPADPLETIAEVVSDIEPGTAANILRLGGPQWAARADMLAIRACVDVGAEITGAGLDADRTASSALVAILRAQSKQINGKPADAEHELWPLFARAARDRAGDSEVQFELEWLAFLRARHGGDARQIHRVATNLERVARDRPAWRSRALLAQAEARIRCGRLQDATVQLEEADERGLRSFAFRQLASSSVLKGEIALQRGDDAAAERLARGAYLILRGRHCDAYKCQTTIARARLRLGTPWSCPDDLGNLSTTAWDSVAVQIESARHLNARGLGERARKQASHAYQTAATLEYEGLAARAAATLGFTFAAGPQRREWCLRALSHLLATRDRSIGCDLFVRDPFPAFDDAISDLLYAGLQNAVPQLRIEADAESPAARTFLRHLSAYVLGSTPFSDELSEAIDAIDSRARSFGQYMLYFLDDATGLLEGAFAAIVSAGRRAEMDGRLTHALRAFDKAVQPRDDPRRFLVG